MSLVWMIRSIRVNGECVLWLLISTFPCHYKFGFNFHGVRHGVKVCTSLFESTSLFFSFVSCLLLYQNGISCRKGKKVDEMAISKEKSVCLSFHPEWSISNQMCCTQYSFILCIEKQKMIVIVSKATLVFVNLFTFSSPFVLEWAPKIYCIVIEPYALYAIF
jgi:hypothetical protein